MASTVRGVSNWGVHLSNQPPSASINKCFQLTDPPQNLWFSSEATVVGFPSALGAVLKIDADTLFNWSKSLGCNGDVYCFMVPWLIWGTDK